MKKKLYWKKNKEIKYREVRLVGDNITQGIYTTNDALSLAEEQELDLVLINENGKPPVCKIIDYHKMIYNEKKKLKELQKKNKMNAVNIKEIRLSPNISEGDILHKINNAISFLKSGDKVKFVMKFKGRQIVHDKIGQKTLLDVSNRLSEYGIPESMPKMEGRNLQIQFKPKK